MQRISGWRGLEEFPFDGSFHYVETIASRSRFNRITHAGDTPGHSASGMIWSQISQYVCKLPSSSVVLM